MVRRGCIVILLVLGAFVALYAVVFAQYFPVDPPGNAIVAGFFGVFAAMAFGAVASLRAARRDAAAFARAARGETPPHGGLMAAAGPIRPSGAPLTSPLGGKPCVAYDYEVKPPDTHTRWKKQGAQRCDIAGFAMAAPVIDTPHGGVRLLGFPLLDEFRQWSEDDPAGRARARAYLASTSFEVIEGVGAFQLVSALDDAIADADGVVRKDFRLTKGPIPFDERLLREHVVSVGQQVCALGRYDAEKRALVPAGTMLTRLWPGSAEQVRKKVVESARASVQMAAFLFVVSHGMLGAAIYLGETRYSRDTEEQQFSLILSAVQDRDVATLERVVRRGANPNARFNGRPVLAGLRDPEMAAALIRLGADVNVTNTHDGDTPLIQASRMGITPLVTLLLAAGANPHAAMHDGATALSEAERGEHADVAALLRAALAAADTAPVERPR